MQNIVKIAALQDVDSQFLLVVDFQVLSVINSQVLPVVDFQCVQQNSQAKEQSNIQQIG